MICVWSFGHIDYVLNGSTCTCAAQELKHRRSEDVVLGELRHNTENSKQIFPEKELQGLSPNFHIQVSLIDLQYIFPQTVCLFCCRKICGPILGIYKTLTDTWICKFGLSRAIPFLGTQEWDFRRSALTQYKKIMRSVSVVVVMPFLGSLALFWSSPLLYIKMIILMGVRRKKWVVKPIVPVLKMGTCFLCRIPLYRMKTARATLEEWKQSARKITNRSDYTVYMLLKREEVIKNSLFSEVGFNIIPR